MLRVWCLAAVLPLLLTLPAETGSASLTCIDLTQLNASAPEGVKACCSKEWYTSYSGIKGTIPAGTKRIYCGSPTDRAVDYRLARTNTSWYEYCLASSCPLEDVEICCIADTPATNTTTIPSSSTATTTPYPSPSPSPSPASVDVGSRLWRQYGAIWAVYMCPHAAPSTTLFAHALTTPADAPATATAKAAPLNLTTAPASKLLAACPSVPEGASPPALDTTFNFSAQTATSDKNLGLSKGSPHMLSFFRKPSLGAVKIVLSVRLDGDQPDSLIYDRVTITLDPPSPAAVAALPSLPTSKGSRRKLQGSFYPEGELAIEGPYLDGQGSGCPEAEDAEQGPRRRLQRGGGAGGGGGGFGRTRGRGRSSTSYNYEGYSIAGIPAYSNMTLNTTQLYRGSLFPGVQFAQYYVYSGKGSSYTSSSRWQYPVPSGSTLKDKIAFAVPALYRYSYVVNSSVVNTTYGFYGPSVFRTNSTFQYLSNTRWPAPKGAPECNACADSTSCCSGGRSCCQGNGFKAFDNSNWVYGYLQPSRRATLLSCGLIQDFVTTLPIYLPSNAADLYITIHSVEATATTAAPACGDTTATLDPREPPFYVTVLTADQVYVRSPSSAGRSGGSRAASALLSMLLAAVAVALSACAML